MIAIVADISFNRKYLLGSGKELVNQQRFCLLLSRAFNI